MVKVPFSTPLITNNSLFNKLERLTSFGPDEAILSKDGKYAILTPKMTQGHWSHTLKKIACIATLIIQLIALAVKLILRSRHKVDLIDGAKLLGREIVVDPATLGKIKGLMPTLFAHADANREGEITFHKDQQFDRQNQLIRQIQFSLDSDPEHEYELQLKEGNLPVSGSVQRSLHGLLQAQGLLHQQDFPHLALDQVAIETVEHENNRYSLIVRKKGDREFSSSVYFEKFFRESESLTEAVRSLTKLTVLYGLDYYNTFIRDSEIVIQGGCLSSPNPWARNSTLRFAASLPDSLCQVVCEEAAQMGIILSPDEIEAERDKEMSPYHRLKWLQDQGIYEGKEPLAEIDYNSLSLPNTTIHGTDGSPLLPKPQKQSCLETAQSIVQQIRDSIARGHGKSVADHRHVYIFYGSNSIYKSVSDEAMEKWSYTILTALEDQGYIYGFERESGYGRTTLKIQA